MISRPIRKHECRCFLETHRIRNHHSSFFRNDKLGVSIVLRSADDEPLDAATTEMRQIMLDLGGEPLDEA